MQLNNLLTGLASVAMMSTIGNPIPIENRPYNTNIAPAQSERISNPSINQERFRKEKQIRI